MSTQSLADLRGRGRQGCTLLPQGPNSFIFMQFSAKKLQDNFNLKDSDLISQRWSMRICRNIWKPENIPVRCALPACQPYMFWWLPLGVSTSGNGGWVSQVPWYTHTYGHTHFTPPGHTAHLDIAPRHIPHPSGHTPTPSWHTHPLLVTLGGHHWKHTDPLTCPPLWKADKHLWKHYLPATLLEGVNQGDWIC